MNAVFSIKREACRPAKGSGAKSTHAACAATSIGGRNEFAWRVWSSERQRRPRSRLQPARSAAGQGLQYRTNIRLKSPQSMQFSVLRMRYQGRALPRRELANRIRTLGDLRVEQVYDEALHRYVRMARLLDPARPLEPDQLPPLYEPALVAMSPLAFTLSGFERMNAVDYAQSWLVTGSA